NRPASRAGLCNARQRVTKAGPRCGPVTGGCLGLSGALLRVGRQIRGSAHRGEREHAAAAPRQPGRAGAGERSEEHTSELQSLAYLVCRLLLEKKKNKINKNKKKTDYKK